MSALELQIYDLLKIKLGEKEASSLMNYIAIKSKEVTVEKVAEYQSLNSKDLEMLRKEMHNLFATKEDFNSLRIEFKETKAEMIKWMFIFWIGQIAATFGFIMLFLKK